MDFVEAFAQHQVCRFESRKRRKAECGEAVGQQQCDAKHRGLRNPVPLRYMMPVMIQIRRNGAYFWQLFHDSEDPTRFVETFMDESWLEHLRQHERVSVAEREIQRRAKQFLAEGESTKSSHWLADRES